MIIETISWYPPLHWMCSADTVNNVTCIPGARTNNGKSTLHHWIPCLELSLQILQIEWLYHDSQTPPQTALLFNLYISSILSWLFNVSCSILYCQAGLAWCTSAITNLISPNLIWDIYSGIKIARSTRVSRWRPEKNVLRCRRNECSDWADVTSLGRLFHTQGAATGKARLPTYDSYYGLNWKLLITSTRP